MVMKVIVVLALFAVSSSTAYASANVFHSNCSDQAAENWIRNHIPINCSRATSVKEVCGDNCYGRVCTYYTKNNYSALCAMEFAELCFEFHTTPAVSCQRCYDKSVMAVVNGLPASCQLDNFNGEAFCTKDCVGAICTFYRDKDYPKDCRAAMAELCTETGVLAPISC